MRPTNYSDEVMESALRYAEGAWADFGDLVPTVVGLAAYIGVSRDTCYAWDADGDKPEFSDILSRIKESQERGLINGGLGSRFNSAITKMLLTKHGYSDKQAIDHTSSDGTMSPKGKSLDDFYGEDVPAKPQS